MISPHDIIHIARLARIELLPEEETLFKSELASILNFIEKLNSAPATHAEPLTGGTISENVVREDSNKAKELIPEGHTLISVAPQKKDTWVKVKTVFE